jgi:phosphate acetyltransferase
LELNSKFLETLVERASKKQPSMIFPESQEEKILKAASAVAELGAVKPVLLGNSEDIRAAAANFQVDISRCEIMENTPELREKVKDEYLKISSEYTEKTLRRRFADPQYLGAAMVRVHMVDCMASGYSCTTAETVLACKMMLGMKEGISVVSSLCVLEDPSFHGPDGDLLCFTDCVVFPNPNSQELAEIAISSSDTMHALLGWKTRAALLSYSTKGGAEGELVDKVRNAVEIAHQLRPDLLIDGEFQLDAAIDPVVAKKKVKVESEVAGKANIIVFPDLNAGNIGVKLVNYFGHLPVHGALIQGLSVPTVDFSRSASLEQIIGALLMLAVAVSA